MALTKRNLRTNNNKELLRKTKQKKCFVYFSLSAKHILYCCLLISHIPLFQFFVVVVVDVFSLPFFLSFFLKVTFCSVRNKHAAMEFFWPS